MSKFAIAIMAAGKGTRLKSKRPKVLHEIGGKPLLAHVIRAASQVVAPEDIVVIIGHEAEKVRAAVSGQNNPAVVANAAASGQASAGGNGVKFAVQAEQRG